LIEAGKKKNDRPQQKVLSNGYWIASIASTSLLIEMPQDRHDSKEEKHNAIGPQRFLPWICVMVRPDRCHGSTNSFNVSPAVRHRATATLRCDDHISKQVVKSLWTSVSRYIQKTFDAKIYAQIFAGGPLPEPFLHLIPVVPGKAGIEEARAQ
jgi:hypothetical protein